MNKWIIISCSLQEYKFGDIIIAYFSYKINQNQASWNNLFIWEQMVNVRLRNPIMMIFLLNSCFLAKSHSRLSLGAFFSTHFKTLSLVTLHLNPQSSASSISILSSRTFSLHGPSPLMPGFCDTEQSRQYVGMGLRANRQMTSMVILVVFISAAIYKGH